MADTVDCPACGAPLTYSKDQEIVLCNFCGASFDPTPDDENVPLRVHAQPEPQKDVLDQQASAALSTSLEDLPPEEDATPPYGTSLRPAELPTVESATIMEGPAPVDVTPEDFSAPAEPPTVESATVIEMPASAGSSDLPEVKGPADEDMIPNAWSAGLYDIPSGASSRAAADAEELPAAPGETLFDAGSEPEPASPYSEQTVISSSAGLGFEEFDQNRAPAASSDAANGDAASGDENSAPTVFSSSEEPIAVDESSPYTAQTVFSASQEPTPPIAEPPPLGSASATGGGAQMFDSALGSTPPPPPGYPPPSGLPPQRSNRGWLIALAVIAVLCIICVCLGVVISMFLPTWTSEFTGFAPLAQQVLRL